MENWLVKEFHLCYIDKEKLGWWIRENKLEQKDFQEKKNQWAKKINQEPNFFSNTELLLAFQDIILVKVVSDNHLSFLAKTYRLEYQAICQKIFHESKNIILVSNQQWQEKKSNEEEKLIVLLKDKEHLEKSLTNWLEKVAEKN